jgi:uncharacterized membrane protein
MAAFTAWKFDTPDGAGRAADALARAQREHLVRIVDHAVVSWPVGAANPSIHHGHDETKRGAGWGAFWGLFLGALFLIPVIGAAAGAAIGAAAKAAEKLGMSEQQLASIRAEVTEGTSALFVVSEQADLDRLGERFIGVPMKLLSTNLTEAERDVLLESF